MLLKNSTKLYKVLKLENEMLPLLFQSLETGLDIQYRTD